LKKSGFALRTRIRRVIGPERKTCRLL